jgi:hypothetical protein
MVRTASRSIGGEAHLPHAHSANCNLREIGVAVNVKTSTSALSCLSFSFCTTPTEMLVFVDHQQPEMSELDILGEQRMRAEDDVERTIGELFFDLACLLGRDSWPMRSGYPAKTARY